MFSSVVRFGVAMESSLLADFDALVEKRGVSRSEVLRDLVRAELTRAKVRSGAEAVAALTLVYDHHIRELGDKLTSVQHGLGDAVRSTMHVHLDHDHCLEVIVMRGPADALTSAAERILAMRGVKHGGIEIFAANLRAHDAGDVHDHGSGPHRHATAASGGLVARPGAKRKKRTHASPKS